MEPEEEAKPEYLWDFEIQAKNMPLEQFALRYPHPFLVQRSGDTDSEGSLSYATRIGMPVVRPDFKADTAEMHVGASSGRQDRGRVHRMAKRSKTPFVGMITLGRARNNDICLPSAQVSKFHAHFHPQNQDACWFSDAGSTNGTKVNGKAIPEGQKVELNDGDWLSFGLDMHFIYHTASGFYRSLTQNAPMSRP